MESEERSATVASGIQDDQDTLSPNETEVLIELDISRDKNEDEDTDNNEEHRATPISIETAEKGIQVQRGILPIGGFSVENLSKLDGAMHYYTSFADIDHFNYVFKCLGDNVDKLNYKCQSLKTEDEFLLTLMKLRLSKDDVELGWMFGISRKTVGRVFKTWLNFMFFQFKELDIWPSRDIVDLHMPEDFKRKFPKTRVILDGSEIPIEKPSDLRDQSATWSNYKNRNTLKIIVGISPRGDVTFISDVYGGAASDRQITERSDLLKAEKFQEGDSIMADRGFIVQDLFASKGVHVNIPTVMRNMVQLPPENVIQDRRIASKRVHVERIIALAKTFRILKEELDHSYVPLGGRILYVCFSLQNFRPSIMDNLA